MDKNKEYEYIKLKVKRSTIAQINSIANDLNINTEELYNRVLEDGLSINQVDFFLRNELAKKSRLDSKIAEIYSLSCKKYLFYGQNYVIFEKVAHLYADFALFLRKKNFTPSELLVVSKLQDTFKYVLENYKEEFEEIKLCLSLQNRTQPYKLLFSQLGIPNQKTIVGYSNSIDTNSVTESDDHDDLERSENSKKTA